MSQPGSFPIAVSEELHSSLLSWNERMGPLVRTPEAFGSSELAAMRCKLNEEGEQLARRIVAEHNGQVEFRFLAE